MRILIISHFYPPIRDGGYAQLCEEVSNRLRLRDHHIEVLTSRYKATSCDEEESNIYRSLFLENDLVYYSPGRFFARWYIEEALNDRIIRRIVDRVNPDIIFVWGMYGLSKSIPAMLERLMPERVVYFISDHWPVDSSFHNLYWERPAYSRVGRITKPFLASISLNILRLRNYPPKLQYKHAIIVSETVRRNLLASGLPIEDSVVIHSGSDVTQYLYHREYDGIQNGSYPLKLLYAGNLGHHKGVHTAVEAFFLLQDELKQGKLTLTIIGGGHPAYIKQLQQLISTKNLDEWISMSGKVPREKIPELLKEHDVLLLPSICEDALPRIVQEAMLSGMAVIGSNRGGIPEMLDHDDTGLIFEAEDDYGLSQLIRRLVTKSEMVNFLAKNGQSKALKEFTLDVMVDNIERYLLKLACT